MLYIYQTFLFFFRLDMNFKATPHALTLMNAKLQDPARNSVPTKLVHIRYDISCSSSVFSHLILSSTSNSSQCECGKGYMREPNHHNICKANEGHDTLLFTHRHDIRKMSLERNEMTSIVNNTKPAAAFDYVFRSGMIFWSDLSEHKIYKAPIDKSNERIEVVNHSNLLASGLAVDWIYNHIYYLDLNRSAICVANFNGSMTKQLIEDNIVNPEALALDPIHGFMYWTEWGSIPRIERAGMDGRHRQIIISTNIKWPNGLTLDFVLNRIYWVDAKLNIISSSNFDGSDRRVILSSLEFLKHPFSITTFEDYVYWTDWGKAAVFKANKFNGGNVQALTATGMVCIYRLQTCLCGEIKFCCIFVCSRNFH